MTGVKRASIRTQLIVGYTDILRSTRKGLKGLRSWHLFAIMLIGDNGGELRLCEAAIQSKRSQQCIFNRFGRVINAGFIYKSNKRYYLTDSGKAAYNAVCKQFDHTLEEIIKELVAEAVRRANG